MKVLLHLIVGLAIVFSVSCRSNTPTAVNVAELPTPIPETSPWIRVTWSSSDLIEQLEDNKDLKRAWENFERSQKYRLAQPSDRKLTPEAMARVKKNSENQIIPFLVWWGASGYVGAPEFLVAIVVDPSRSDAKRYGLVVIAAPKSEGVKYKAYWVLQEEDLESYLISPASGSVYMECYRRDGTEEVKEIVWRRSIHQFRLE